MGSPKIRGKAKNTLTTVVQHGMGSFSQYNKQERETKGMQIRKDELKPYFFADDMMVYEKIPRNLLKKQNKKPPRTRE